MQIETVWNIGGRELYAWGVGHPSLHRLYLTRIHTPFPQCDVFFPAIDWAKMHEITDGSCDNEENYYGRERCENGVTYSFHVFEPVV